jgi:hypothetical protein
MPSVNVGVFTVDYELSTNAQPGFDIKFGMTRLIITSTLNKPLAQFIYPAVSVGSNVAGRWNIDNHNPSSIIFAEADNGTIRDSPVEIVARNVGLKETRFVVYWIDIDKKCIGSPGVTFGYSIDTNVAVPITGFLNAKSYDLSDEHKKLISGKSPWLNKKC